LVTGARVLTTEHLAWLAELLQKHDLVLANVQTEVRATAVAGAMAGYSVAQGERPAQAEPLGAPALYLNHAVRSGVEVRHPGTVVVGGDVNPGGCIVADGDIWVGGLLEAHGIRKIALIVNRIRPQMVQANNMMSVSDVQEILAIPLAGLVPDDERVIISTNRGEPLVLEANLSLPGIAFHNIARRLEGEKVPLLDLDAPYNTLMGRLRRFFSR